MLISPNVFFLAEPVWGKLITTVSNRSRSRREPGEPSAKQSCSEVLLSMGPADTVAAFPSLRPGGEICHGIPAAYIRGSFSFVSVIFQPRKIAGRELRGYVMQQVSSPPWRRSCWLSDGSAKSDLRPTKVSRCPRAWSEASAFHSFANISASSLFEIPADFSPNPLFTGYKGH